MVTRDRARCFRRYGSAFFILARRWLLNVAWLAQFNSPLSCFVALYFSVPLVLDFLL
jgi:hypothetical protein